MVLEIKSTAENIFKGTNGSHDWEHTLRVSRLCQFIGLAEETDMDVLLSAAYLHDIGRCFQDRSNGVVCHAEKGADMAKSIIDEFAFSEDQKKNIIHCVKTHRFRGEHIPESIEAKVLFDADKLDAIGAIGIARAYMFAGELGSKFHNRGNNIENSKPYSREDTGYREYKVKLCKIKDRIITKEGQKIAEQRHSFMNDFFIRFLKEYDGVR